MILYELRCSGGHRFEAALASMAAANPPCPLCQGSTGRIPAAARAGRRADPGPAQHERSHSWRGIGSGHPDAVAHWRERITRRERLEEKYPELAGDRRPVLAHEGVFAARPLRAGDDVGAALAQARSTAAGNGATPGPTDTTGPVRTTATPGRPATTGGRT